MMELTLDRMKYVAQMVISEHVFALTHDPELIIFHQAHDLVMRLEGDFFGRHHFVMVHWPDGWLQAFKDRWFPKWAKKKWPIRMQVRQLDARVAFEGLPKIEKYIPRYHVAVIQRPMSFWDGEKVPQ